MAYKRYIKKGGKFYGPYTYHSRKENGKVISEYIGKSSTLSRKNNLSKFVFVGILLIFLLIFFVFLYNFILVGKVTLLVDEIYSDGETLKGNMRLSLQPGELMPVSTKVFINNSDVNYEYILSDLLSDPTIEVQFYIENKNITGFGLGYGVTNATYPIVDFVLDVYYSNQTIIQQPFVGESEEEPETNITVSNETEITKNETIQEPSETSSNETLEKPEEIASNESTTEITESTEVSTETQTIEQPSETTEETTTEISQESENSAETGSESISEVNSETAPLTGQIIKRIFAGVSNFFLGLTGKSILGQEIQGQLSFDKPFFYELQEGQTAKIVSSSQDVFLEIKDNKVIVTTNYKGNSGKEFLINLTSLKIPAKQGELIISFYYNENELVKAVKNIEVINETLLTNYTNLTEFELNMTEFNISLAEITINTTQYGAVINKLVRWKKQVEVTGEGIVKLEIPLQAENITIYRIIGEKQEKIKDKIDKKNESYQDSKKSPITGGVAPDIDVETDNETEITENETIQEPSETIFNETIEEEIEITSNQSENIENESTDSETNSNETEIIREEISDENIIFVKKISGEASLDIELDREDPKIIKFFKKLISLITGKAIEVTEKEEVLELNIIENATSFEIEYQTPGPVSNEINTYFGKEISISSEVHYENILAYTELPFEIPEKFIRLYYVSDKEKYLVNITTYDINNNSLADYVEWIIPSLSDKNYSLEIKILNIQSYPTVGGNWTVVFDTFGEGNLTIKVVNGTTWSNENENEDLMFLKILCGNNILNNQWIDNFVFIENYSCNQTGYEISKVLTPGVHNLEFDFGGIKAYANNFAFSQTDCIQWNNGVFSNVTCDGENLTLSYTELPNYGFQRDWMNMSGNVLLYHLNNDSSYGENETRVFDFSGNGNNGSININADSVFTPLTKGFYFNGSENIIVRKHNSLNVSNFTVLLRFKPGFNLSSTSGVQTLISKSNGTGGYNFHIELNKENLTALVSTSSGNTILTYNVSSFVHANECSSVTFTSLYPNFNLYLNNVSLASGLNFGSVLTYDNFFTIGSFNNSNFFNGTLDEIAVFNRLLQNGFYDVQEIYYAQTFIHASS